MKILVDKTINLNKLKKFIQENKDIKIIELNIENSSKKTEKVIPLGVWDYGTWGSFRWGGQENGDIFEKIKKLVGKENMGDTLHVESAIHEEINFLLTEDKDIISKREQLEKTFNNLRIKTLEEFKSENFTR